MFATDRDLLVLEPRLLREVAWVGQRVYANASVAVDAGGTGVTDGAGPFESFGIGVGSVLLLNDLVVEIVDVPGPTQATISLVRGSRDGEAIPASSLGATAKMDVDTFVPQIELVHRQVLRGLGLAPGVTEIGGAPAEDRVVNVEAMADLEALGALHLIYAAATPLASEASAIAAKAAAYQERFRAARLGIGAEIDLDGDGVADATRHVGAFQLVRR
jgi:hypothetical protein